MAKKKALYKDFTTGEVDPQTVSEYDQTTTPTNEAAKAKLYAKDVSGVAKMHALSSDGTEIELGSGGGGGSVVGNAVEAIAPSHSNNDLSPLASYSLDNSILDESGNSYDLSLATGTSQFRGTTHVPGASSAYFDAASRLTGGSVPALNLQNDVTIFAWVSIFNFATTTQHPIVNYSGVDSAEANNAAWALYITNTAKIGYYHENGAGVGNLHESPANMIDNNPQFVAITRAADGVSVKIYVNGVFVDSYTAPSAPTGGTTSTLNIGGWANDANNAHGSIWDVQVFAAEFTAEQIRNEYLRQVGRLGESVVTAVGPRHVDTTPLTPVVAYPLDGTLADSSGNGYDLSIAGGSEEYSGMNHVPGDSSFFSSGNWLTATAPAALLLGEMTAMAWINPSVFGSCMIFGFGGNGESLPTNILWSIGLETSGRLRVFHEYGAGSNELYNTANYTLREGLDQHVAISRSADGLTYKIYVNGVFVETIVTANAPADGSSGFITVGADPGGLDPYSGAVWDIAVFDSQLTDVQIQEEYLRQVGQSPVVRIGRALHGLDHSPLALYQFNGDGVDSSGNARDLTPTGTIEYYSGHVGMAFRQNGTDKFTRTDAAFAITGELSVMALVHLDTVASAVYAVATYDGVAVTQAENKLWALQLEADGTYLFPRYQHQHGVGTPDVVTSSSEGKHVTPGEWVWVGFTRDSAGTGIKLFINGELATSETLADPPDGGGSSFLNVGSDGAGDGDFLGVVQSLKIVGAELTEAEMKAEYERCFGVGDGTGISHQDRHLSGGDDEIDGDRIDIDWSPTNYTPTTSPTEVTSAAHLTAHLAGIDAALPQAIQTLTSSSNQTAVDASLGTQFKLNNLAENTEIQIPTSGTDGDQLTISVENTGGHTVTFASGWVNSGQLAVSTEATRVSLVTAVARDFGSGLEWSYSVDHAEVISGVTDIDASLQTVDATVTTIATFITTTNDSAYLVDASIIGVDKTADEVYQRGLRAMVMRDGAGTLTVKDISNYSTYNEDGAWDSTVTVSGSNILVRVTGDGTNAVDWRIKGIVQEVS